MANEVDHMPQPQPQGQAQPAQQRELKYHAQLQLFTNCPPRGNGGYGIGYRWCFEDINDTRNALPVSLLQPERKRCCTSWSLSMFATLDQAVAKFNAVKADYPEFATRVGTHYAQVRLSPETGRSTPAANSGHFDFFEYTTFRLVESVIEHRRRPE